MQRGSVRGPTWEPCSHTSTPLREASDHREVTPGLPGEINSVILQPRCPQVNPAQPTCIMALLATAALPGRSPVPDACSTSVITALLWSNRMDGATKEYPCRGGGGCYQGWKGVGAGGADGETGGPRPPQEGGQRESEGWGTFCIWCTQDGWTLYPTSLHHHLGPCLSPPSL